MHRPPTEDSHSRIAFSRYRIENRLQIAGRGVDDLQHFGGRGLLFQRLALLGDKPRVLHRDHRLGGEVFQQRDLFVGERANFLAIDRMRPRTLSSLMSGTRRTVRVPPRSAMALPPELRLGNVRYVGNLGSEAASPQMREAATGLSCNGARVFREFGIRRGNAVGPQQWNALPS